MTHDSKHERWLTAGAVGYLEQLMRCNIAIPIQPDTINGLSNIYEGSAVAQSNVMPKTRIYIDFLNSNQSYKVSYDING